MAHPVLSPHITEITGDHDDFDGLIERIGDARFVLLGESTHGTHQFYRDRARITRKLLARGFDAVAVEADWPDAMRVTRYVRGEGLDDDGVEALSDFERFPTWMWRNADVLDLVGWLREYNEHHDRDVGFYGLDLYSLHRSLDAAVAYIDDHHPDLAARARAWVGCFDRFGDDPQRYGRATAFGLEGCEDDVARLLTALRERAGGADLDAHFDAEQNARIAAQAEAYYRAMFTGRPNTWNLRDTHMADTLDALAAHLEAKHGHPARIVVWAHNSHIGDARATSAAVRGETNLGALVRERHGDEAFLVGFTTFTGTVTAASDWGGAAERKSVRPALVGSWEHELHQVLRPRFWLDCHEPALAEALSEERLQRFIGVLYLPDSERWSHYFECQLGAQYDAVVHYDTTRAVEPLERSAGWERGELPDTWPTTL